jgi:hypothetical protein
VADAAVEADGAPIRPALIGEIGVDVCRVSPVAERVSILPVIIFFLFPELTLCPNQ